MDIIVINFYNVVQFNTNHVRWANYMGSVLDPKINIRKLVRTNSKNFKKITSKQQLIFK